MSLAPIWRSGGLVGRDGQSEGLAEAEAEPAAAAAGLAAAA